MDHSATTTSMLQPAPITAPLASFTGSSRVRLGAAVAVLGALLMGASRVYRDVHWATDVLGGWGVGFVVAAVAAGLYDWLRGERGEFGRAVRDAGAQDAAPVR